MEADCLIPAQTIEEIRKKSDIVKVISEYVPLRKRGRSHLGLCPFHSEKTPSFTVSEEKQLFHCFGCGAGGNIFDFIMQIDNLGFAEAVRELGEKLGIEVEGAGRPNRQRLHETAGDQRRGRRPLWSGLRPRRLGQSLSLPSLPGSRPEANGASRSGTGTGERERELL